MMVVMLYCVVIYYVVMISAVKQKLDLLRTRFEYLKNRISRTYVCNVFLLINILTELHKIFSEHTDQYGSHRHYSARCLGHTNQ